MTEKELIGKIQELRQIKPRKEWVVFTKTQILGETKPSFSFISFLRDIRKGETFVFQHKPAFATLLAFAILFGLFGFSQNSLPGDILFSIKKITEKSQAVFVSENNQLKYDFELANKRLDDLTKVAENNSVKNLEPAINELQASVSKVAESLTKTGKNPQLVKEIALEVKKIAEKKEILTEVYGVAGLESEELDNALTDSYKTVVEKYVKEKEILIKEGKILTEEEEVILAEVKEEYEKGKYSNALEKILLSPL